MRAESWQDSELLRAKTRGIESGRRKKTSKETENGTVRIAIECVCQNIVAIFEYGTLRDTGAQFFIGKPVVVKW